MTIERLRASLADRYLLERELGRLLHEIQIAANL
jgi:hypothetical protein